MNWTVNSPNTLGKPSKTESPTLELQGPKPTFLSIDAGSGFPSNGISQVMTHHGLDANFFSFQSHTSKLNSPTSEQAPQAIIHHSLVIAQNGAGGSGMRRVYGASIRAQHSTTSYHFVLQPQAFSVQILSNTKYCK